MGYYKKPSYIKNKSMANKGKWLEDVISSSNRQYQEKGIAKIDKIATPTTVRREGGQIVGAKYSGKSTVDFIGIDRHGHYIAFDTKEVSGESFPFSSLKPHQVEHLQIITKHGGIGFILIYFKEHNELYRLEFSEYMRLRKELELKSIPYSYFKDNLTAITSRHGVYYDYLREA